MNTDTPMPSDIRILESLLALNLDISLWSARKKLTLEDFGNVELPPDDLATLGSKRIAPPENLRIFGTLKAAPSTSSTATACVSSPAGPSRRTRRRRS